MAEGTDGDVEVKEKPQPKKELSIAEKIDKAVVLKEEGNHGFKSGDVKEAVKKYNYGYLVPEGARGGSRVSNSPGGATTGSNEGTEGDEKENYVRVL